VERAPRALSAFGTKLTERGAHVPPFHAAGSGEKSALSEITTVEITLAPDGFLARKGFSRLLS
jgi:hypothetical protein